MEELKMRAVIHHPAQAAAELVKGIAETYPADVRASQLTYVKQAVERELDKTKEDLRADIVQELLTTPGVRRTLNGALVEMKYGSDAYRYAHNAEYRKLRTQLTILERNMREAARKGEKGEHAAILYPSRCTMNVYLDGVFPPDPRGKKRKNAPAR